MVTIEQLQEVAFETRKLLGWTRPGNRVLRVGPTFGVMTCGHQALNVAHVHSHKGHRHYGRICINLKALVLDLADWKRIILHEMIHFKIHRHGMRFQKFYYQFDQSEGWNAMLYKAWDIVGYPKRYR